MNNEEFNYWIDGYLSLTDEEYLNVHQVNIIKNHAKLVESTVGLYNLSCISFAETLITELDHHEVISKVNFEKLVNKILFLQQV
jgi:hypothetical protein